MKTLLKKKVGATSNFALKASKDTLRRDRSIVLSFLIAVSFLSGCNRPGSPEDTFVFELSDNELLISYQGDPIAGYVMSDPSIPRPYFHSLKTSDGIQVTRNHPPVEGLDATDHAEYHPGLWMAFGDISGHDFWRNKAAVKHKRFIQQPQVEEGRLSFGVENGLYGEDGKLIGYQRSRFAVDKMTNGFLLSWDDEYEPSGESLVFGDQEEMGLGLRMATPLTELATGLIRSSTSLETAKATWGQEAEWCDYSGTTEGKHAGIALFAHPDNFRPSWWHNRNYGAMVANAFGRKAMRQGDKSAVPVEPGETLRLRYGIYWHSSEEQASLEELNALFADYAANNQ